MKILIGTCVIGSTGNAAVFDQGYIHSQVNHATQTVAADIEAHKEVDDYKKECEQSQHARHGRLCYSTGLFKAVVDPSRACYLHTAVLVCNTRSRTKPWLQAQRVVAQRRKGATESRETTLVSGHWPRAEVRSALRLSLARVFVTMGQLVILS